MPRRLRTYRLLPVLFGVTAMLLLHVAGPAGPAGPAVSHADTVVVHAGYTAQLRAALDGDRRAAGLDPLFERADYRADAVRMASAAVNNQPVTGPRDGAPGSWQGWQTVTSSLDEAVATAVEELRESLDLVVRYPLHTDGGWAVVVRGVAPGLTEFAVAGVVGWPAAVIGRSGCATGLGFCWAAPGLNPHLPWTRNQVKVYLSTSGLPAEGESLLRAGIARLNAATGFGADVVYAGRTTATTTSDQHRFLVRWATSGCPPKALACASIDTHGAPEFVVGARVVAMRHLFTSTANREYWVGTFAHELAHAVGLHHYDAPFAGRYQMMRWAAGPNRPQVGDVNGLRRTNPAGRLSAALRVPARVRAGQTLTALVRAGSTGLGGVRSITLQCTDGNGNVRSFATRSGTWDITARDYGVSFTVPGGRAYAARCRALVKSKASRTYSAWVGTTLGG